MAQNIPATSPLFVFRKLKSDEDGSRDGARYFLDVLLAGYTLAGFVRFSKCKGPACITDAEANIREREEMCAKEKN